MEIGKINKTELAEKLHPALKTLFDFIKQTDFDNLEYGKIQVEGDNIFVMNLNIPGKSKEEQPLEMHRDYIDVHVLINGQESIGWKPLSEISTFTQEYEKDSDCALSTENPRFYVDLIPGEYCIVFPDDAHAPAISSGQIRKLIGKVKI